MNYLVKTESGKFIVISNVKKDWSKYISSNTKISLGDKTGFVTVIQEIEIR